MTDEKLLEQTREFVKNERALLKQILLNLKEIEYRRLYLKRGLVLSLFFVRGF